MATNPSRAKTQYHGRKEPSWGGRDSWFVVEISGGFESDRQAFVKKVGCGGERTRISGGGGFDEGWNLRLWVRGR